MLYSANKHTEMKLNQDKGIRDKYCYIARVLRGQRKNDSISQAFEAQGMLLGSWKDSTWNVYNGDTVRYSIPP